MTITSRGFRRAALALFTLGVISLLATRLASVVLTAEHDEMNRRLLAAQRVQVAAASVGGRWRNSNRSAAGSWSAAKSRGSQRRPGPSRASGRPRRGSTTR